MPVITSTRLRINGRVQGVFYRQTARDKARALGLGGWVRNTDDGAVEMEVWGPTDRVEEMIVWCHCGPPAANVTSVDVEWREERDDQPEERPHFAITY